MTTSAGPAGGRRTVYVHIGAPKTGTTFLQNLLWANRDALAEQGLLYPLAEEGEHFAAAMDVRQMMWGGVHDPAWDGTWDRIVERIEASGAPRAVVSNELLGGATRDQVTRLAGSLAGADLHVIFTARDLSRQFPSDWQEQVKHTHTVRYGQFVDDLITLGRNAPAPFGEMFWDLHDPMDVLPRWAQVVGPDHVHVVTVAPRSRPGEGLWDRFASVIGVDPARVRLDDLAANRSLGVVEAELLRRLNDRGRLAERLTWMYDGLARLELGEWILARRPHQRRIGLPEEQRAWVAQRSEQIITGLRDAGYRVTGDLEELRPDFAGDDVAGSPDGVTDSELLTASLEVISDLLLRLGVVQNPPPEPAA